MAMVSDNHQTPTTRLSLSPTCSLELDFPWLMSCSTPTLQPQAPPAGAPPQSLDNMLNFTNSWSPVKGIETESFADTTTRSSPSRVYSSRDGSPGTSPGSQLTQGSSGYFSLNLSSSGSDTSSPSPQPPTGVVSAGKPTSAAVKPHATYIEMIAKALISAPGQKMILQDLYAHIQQHYPYYQTASGTWKNSVRHNLCVNECFMKAGRSNSSRGFYWSIHPACTEMFSRGDFSRMKAKRLAQKMYKSIRAAAESSSTCASKSVPPPGATYSAAQVLPGGTVGAYSAMSTVPTAYPYAPSASIYTPRVPVVSNSGTQGHLQQTSQSSSFSNYGMVPSSMANTSSRVPVSAPHYYPAYSGYFSSQGGYPTSVYPSSSSSHPATGGTARPTYNHSSTYNSYYSQGTATPTYQMTVPRFL